MIVYAKVGTQPRDIKIDGRSKVARSGFVVGAMIEFKDPDSFPWTESERGKIDKVIGDKRNPECIFIELW